MILAKFQSDLFEGLYKDDMMEFLAKYGKNWGTSSKKRWNFKMDKFPEKWPILEKKWLKCQQNIEDSLNLT